MLRVGFISGTMYSHLAAHSPLEHRFDMLVLKNLAQRLALTLAACLPLTLAACATPPTDPAQREVFEQNNDPLEPMNRTIFDFNDAAYTYVLFPVARGY